MLLLDILVELLEAGELGREAALGGSVDNEDDLALVGVQAGLGFLLCRMARRQLLNDNCLWLQGWDRRWTARTDEKGRWRGFFVGDVQSGRVMKLARQPLMATITRSREQGRTTPSWAYAVVGCGLWAAACMQVDGCGEEAYCP